MADPAIAGAIASLTMLALLLALIVLLRPSLVARFLLAPLLPGVIFRGNKRRRELALTIDDGPSPGSAELLALLRELQLPATLFVISGHLAQADPAYLAQALADGHTIGHHMDIDSVSARLSPAAFRQAFDRAAADLRAAAAPRGLPLHWFRPGGGWIRPSMLRSVAARGYRMVLGSIFPWDTFHPPLTWMAWFVLCNAHPGAILVLHDRPDTLPATIELLRRVVPALRQRGYRFVSLDRLLSR
jgi:peptidoglycan/xylan/chitin deacetylase (PgdA/CDA1 family)